MALVFASGAIVVMGMRSLDQAHAVLSEVEARLTGSIGCTRVNWLDTSELAVAIRTGFEPGDLPALAVGYPQRLRPDRWDAYAGRVHGAGASVSGYRDRSEDNRFR